MSNKRGLNRVAMVERLISDRKRLAAELLAQNLRFNPVRPFGLGELNIGEAGQIAGGIGGRTASVAHNAADRSTTCTYQGYVQHSEQGTRFTASENVDWNNKLTWSWAIYEQPVEQTFLGPKEGSVTIKDVVMIRSEFRDWSTGYFTTVTTKAGDQHRFVISPFGTVTWYEHGYSYRGDTMLLSQTGCATTASLNSDRKRSHENKSGLSIGKAREDRRLLARPQSLPVQR